MAILIEAISVVFQLETLRERYPGGVDTFEQDTPNRSYCADDHLARVGFLQPAEMEAFAERIDQLGFCALVDGKCADFAIVDQVHGPIAPCDWFEWGRHVDGFNVGWLAGTTPGTIVVPAGWKLEDALNIDAVSPRDASRDRDGLEFVREGDDIDVFRDPQSGREVYLRKQAAPSGAGAPQTPPRSSDAAAPNAATTVSQSDFEELVGRTLEVEEALYRARAGQDTQTGEAIHSELTHELLPRAERYLALAQDKSAAHYAHGVVLRVCGMFDDAIDAYERALELVPDSVPALMEMTVCLGEANRSGDAYPFAKQAVELHPRSAATWGNLALVCIQMGERTEAREALDQALTLDPDDTKNKEIDEHFEELFP
jgi:hypothetical protein